MTGETDDKTCVSLAARRGGAVVTTDGETTDKTDAATGETGAAIGETTDKTAANEETGAAKTTDKTDAANGETTDKTDAANEETGAAIGETTDKTDARIAVARSLAERRSRDRRSDAAISA